VIAYVGMVNNINNTRHQFISSIIINDFAPSSCTIIMYRRVTAGYEYCLFRLVSTSSRSSKARSASCAKL
jgi:hypothetical protein